MKNLTTFKKLIAFVLLTLSAAITANAYDLSFTKTNYPFDVESDPDCIFDFKTNTINFIGMVLLNDHQLKVSVWNNDLSAITHEFILTTPQEYSLPNESYYYAATDCIVTLGQPSEHIESGDGPWIKFAKNLFTNSGLIEGIITIRDNDSYTYLFMDETSKLLGIYKSENEGGLGQLLTDPQHMNGKLIFENGVVVTSNNPGSGTSISSRGDVNSDGKVNVSDVTELVNIILGVIH